MIVKLDYIFAPFAYVFALFILFFVRQSKKIHFRFISSGVIDGLIPLQLNKKYRKLIDSFWLKIWMVSYKIKHFLKNPDDNLKKQMSF